jgi:hypothetical protein
MRRLLTISINIRRVLMGVALIGIMAWQSTWLPATGMQILHLLTLIAAALGLLHEIVYVRYLSKFFTTVEAEVIHHADRQQNDMKVSTFLLKYNYDGAERACTYDDDIINHTIRGKSICKLIVHIKDPSLVFIDTFKFRYLNLIFAIFLLCSVVSMYGVFE